MLKADALILLVNSLSKTEKRSFKLNKKESNYLFLFNAIDSNKNIDRKDLRALFTAELDGCFDVAVDYLYKLILNHLIVLKEGQDSHYRLFNKISKARILFEKSLFEEAFSFLDEVKEEAARMENHYALLYASQLELEWLLFTNHANISEKELANKHLKLKQTLNIIRKISEQSSLYESLRHRIIYKGNIRSKKQKESLYDLVVSEMSIMSSSNVESFEANKLHQLFQSNYLIGVGDYKSALHSYYELNTLFENNKHLWANPPSYYVMVIEGILDNLRSIRNYEQMGGFVDQLRKIHHPSASFQADVDCLVFLYQLFPLLDRGEFADSRQLIEKHRETVLRHVEMLSFTRQAELSLYLALVYIGLSDYKAARKALLRIIIRGKNFYIYPLYRTIRLVNLIIRYEADDFDTIRSETRSIRREISRADKAYRVEHLMLSYLNKPKSSLLFGNREREWIRLEPVLAELRNDVFETQILKLFDFTAWLESKMCKTPLQEVLRQRAARA